MSGVPVGTDESTPTPADVRDLRGMMADWRRGRATRSLFEALQDAYVVVLGVLIVGAMVVNLVLTAQTSVVSCTTTACGSARTVLPWATFALGGALALAAARLFGPVLASAAEGFWLLDAPVDRVALLRRRLAAAVAVAAGLGAALGAGLAALAGNPAAGVLAWAAATSLGGAAAVAVAAAQQGRERHRLTRALQAAATLLGLAALGVAVAVAAGWLPAGTLPPDGAARLGWLLAAGSAVVAAPALAVADRRLRSIRRARLVSGGALVRGLSGAFFALDLGLMRDILLTRRAMEIGHVRPRRGRGLGASALVWRELQRLGRHPAPLVAVAATAVVPYATTALGLPTLAPLLGALALFPALVGMLNGLRVLTRTKGLARSLPLSPTETKLAVVAVPAVVTALWAAAVTPAFVGLDAGTPARPADLAVTLAAVTAVAGLLGAVRWTQAKTVDFGAPMISTSAGAFPPGLVGNVFRGLDVCVLVTAPVVIGLSPAWSLGIAVVAALLLLTFDADAVRARQAEQLRALEGERRRKAAAAAAAQQKKR